MSSSVTIAVAGSRKTQGIVEYCSTLPPGKRVAVLTFTQTNQAELKSRLRHYAGNHSDVCILEAISKIVV